jgi:hypothetical protein
MSVKIVVSFEVENWDNFKAKFDSFEPFRTEAEITANAYKQVGTTNTVFIIGDAPSIEVFQAFSGSDAQAERMKSAGVKSAPNVVVLE